MYLMTATKHGEQGRETTHEYEDLRHRQGNLFIFVNGERHVSRGNKK